MELWGELTLHKAWEVFRSFVRCEWVTDRKSQMLEDRRHGGFVVEIQSSLSELLDGIHIQHGLGVNIVQGARFEQLANHTIGQRVGLVIG